MVDYHRRPSWLVEKKHYKRFWNKHWLELVHLLSYRELTGKGRPLDLLSIWETVRYFCGNVKGLSTTGDTFCLVLRLNKLSESTPKRCLQLILEVLHLNMSGTKTLQAYFLHAFENSVWSLTSWPRKIAWSFRDGMWLHFTFRCFLDDIARRSDLKSMEHTLPCQEGWVIKN